MRDLVLFVLILGGLPFYFSNPFYGILAFYLVSIMNPHRYTWGAAYYFPFAMCITVATLLGFALGRGERNPLPKERETFMLLALWGIFLWSSLNSLVPEKSMDALLMTSKILLMTIIAMLFSCTRERLRSLFWVIAISMGFIGVKGGIFGMVTGGGHKVFGPPDTFIADNNDVGLALNISLPIIYYLANHEESTRVRKIMMGVFFLTALATVLTYSRGSAIALAVLLFLLALMSNKPIRNILVMCILGYFLSFYITDKWTDRMSTIDDAAEDASFMGRVNAWHNAWNMAVDRPLTGGGMAATQSREVFARYAPVPENFHASHSIYFQMLGENGFPGLIVFMILLVSLMIRLNYVRRRFAADQENQWLSNYALTIQLSLFAYMVNGLLLGRAYFDLAYLIIAMGIMVIHLSRKQQNIMGQICAA